MLKKQAGLITIFQQFLDLALVFLSFHAAILTKINLPSDFRGLTPGCNYNFLLVLALLSYGISLKLFGLYGQYRRLKFSQIRLNLLKATITGLAGVVFLGYVVHLEAASRLLLVIFWFYSFLSLLLVKKFVYNSLSRGRSRNLNTRSILVVGSKQRAQDFIKNVYRKKYTGYRIIGCLETQENAELVGDRVYRSIKIIGTVENFDDILKDQTIDEIVFGIPLGQIPEIHNYIFSAEEMGIRVRILPDFQINRIKYYPQTARVEIDDFLGTPTLALLSGPQNSNELLIKSIIDYTGATLGIVLLSPFLAFIALVIKLTSRGPVFYSQERSGMNGRRFMVHKFRTMIVNADKMLDELREKNEMDGPVFKMKKDPRITWIGGILRKTSLDELPQLFNVLKGEMSLVGPRPPIPSEVEEYKLWQRRRLSMKPGLTCIWQVSGRNEVSFEEWMNMDLVYIDNWSLMLDLKLLLQTVREVALGGGR